ncbi:MAG: type II toxin-antitoxin system prevent-host-death family antitoxin [Coriobacteriia bacterium]|nr:type II toxin-antitoxin system prevent-host-death family antitoxin [Coriobacteriia bacterium]
MPVTVPVSEMQRNGAALTEEAMRTKQPIYLTKRGKSAVVLLDAEEYDRQIAYRDAMLAREERILAGISRGHEEVRQGKTVKLEDALSQLDAKWGF